MSVVVIGGAFFFISQLYNSNYDEQDELDDLPIKKKSSSSKKQDSIKTLAQQKKQQQKQPPFKPVEATNNEQPCNSVSEIENHYNELTGAASDINQHLPVLRSLASECEHMTELGVRFVVSSWAFAMGGVDRIRNKLHFTYISGDITKQPQVNDFENVMKKCPAMKYQFIEGDDLKTQYEKTDLLFIDTWHVYRQLIKELQHLSPLARKYIVLHDTSLFATRDEDIAGHGGKAEDASLYNGVAPKSGLWVAVEDFLSQNKKWRVRNRLTNNNGLTILERIAPE